MSAIVQITPDYIRLLKKGLVSQVAASSAHISEAIAYACGFRTYAALKAEAGSPAAGRYTKFEDADFYARLSALGTALQPLPLAVPSLGHSARHVAATLSDPAFAYIKLHPRSAEFQLVGINAKTVRIDIRPGPASGYYRFIRSHAIHTPTQIGPYNPGRDFDDDPSYALSRAIDSIVEYYKDAVRAGHTPSGSWLV